MVVQMQLFFFKFITVILCKILQSFAGVGHVCDRNDFFEENGIMGWIGHIACCIKLCLILYIMGAPHQCSPHRLPVVNGVVSMTIFLLYKFLSPYRFIFSESRESKAGNQSG